MLHTLIPEALAIVTYSFTLNQSINHHLIYIYHSEYVVYLCTHLWSTIEVEIACTLLELVAVYWMFWSKMKCNACSSINNNNDNNNNNKHKHTENENALQWHTLNRSASWKLSALVLIYSPYLHTSTLYMVVLLTRSGV